MFEPVNRPTRRIGLSLAAAAFLLTAGSAQAHLALLPRSAPAGTPVKVDVRVFHGCGDRPTTSVTVKIPDGFILPAPQVKQGWEISTKSAPYKAIFQIGDRMVKEGFTEVTWSGGRLPADYMDDFSIAGMLPQRPGEQLTFPAIQGCLAADGKTTESREFALALKLEAQPAPASPSQLAGGAETPSAAGKEPETNTAGASGAGSPALIVGGLALLLAIVALVRTMRRW